MGVVAVASAGTEARVMSQIARYPTAFDSMLRRSFRWTVRVRAEPLHTLLRLREAVT